MPSTRDGPPALFHLAIGEEWRDAVEGGHEYRRSTAGRSLDDEGFIHCSFAAQVRRVADLFYRGRADVVLLRLDASRIASEIRVEALHGDESFPHIYGPIPVDAVVEATDVRPGPDGRLVLPDL